TPGSSTLKANETTGTTSGTAPQAAYPEFTWDRIPLYMHVRKAKSFTDEEIKFLTRFPLITFEKQMVTKTTARSKREH
ncbi:MAG: hypothetical protein HC814_05020, partial [Rhodobacteraceae bacterium]|nr:hypothetical protein [Paracoccaceae bacterium]